MKTITTPSGYQVNFKDRLTYGDRRAIKKIMRSHMKMELDVDQDTEKVDQRFQPLSMDFTDEMELEVFKRAIDSIKVGEQTHTKNLLDLVYSWDDRDGEAVFDYLNKEFDPMGSASTEAEKKRESYN